jgi:hypothetical protein
MLNMKPSVEIKTVPTGKLALSFWAVLYVSVGGKLNTKYKYQ